MTVKTPTKVLSPPTKVQDAVTVSFPTTTAEKTTVRERLSWQDCLRVSDLTTVTVLEREREKETGGIVVWVGVATGDRVAVATGLKVQEGLETKVRTKPRKQPSGEGRKCSERKSAVRKTAPQKASGGLREEGSKESEQSNEEALKRS
jgi:hypothetical protein